MDITIDLFPVFDSTVYQLPDEVVIFPGERRFSEKAFRYRLRAAGCGIDLV
jgi:hypothetical protein